VSSVSSCVTPTRLSTLDDVVAREIHAVLEKVRQGVEVVVEQDHRPVAIIKTPQRPGRLIDECIVMARADGSGATLDEDFAKDL
jgi:antitoxin (DNA-binding transcriptional repressor) of toxin-antitoxin stability system